MKKILAGGVVIVGVLAVIALMPRVEPESSPQNSIEKQEDTSPQPTATVTTLHSAVALTTPTGTYDIPSSTTTPTNVTLTTSATGRAVIEMGTSKSVVDYSSTVTLVPVTTHTTSSRIFVAAGAVWSRVQKVFAQGEFHEIETRNAVAAVRGTSFSVRYSGETTTLVVAAGTVSFSGIDPTTRTIDTSSEVWVIAGYKAVRVGNGPIVVSALTSADIASEWYQFSVDAPPPKPVAAPTPVSAPVTAPIPPVTRSSGSQQIPALAYPAPTILKVTPTSFSFKSKSTATNVQVTISGRNFSEVQRVAVGTNTVTNLVIVNEQELRVTIPSLPVGTHTVTLIDAANRSVSLTDSLTVRSSN